MKQKQGGQSSEKDADHEKVYVVHRYYSHTSTENEVVEGQVE